LEAIRDMTILAAGDRYRLVLPADVADRSSELREQRPRSPSRACSSALWRSIVMDGVVAFGA
jgi:hypothetical protein